MKVLQINALYGSKSTGLIVKDIANCIKAHGHNSVVMCANSTVLDSDIIAVRTSMSGKIHAILTRLFGRQGCWSQLLTKKTVTQIKQINPDIIHIHNLHSNFISLPLLLKYCTENNKPVVATLHDCWYFTGKCYHFEDICCNQWLSGCGNCPKKMMDIPSLLCDSSASTFKIKQQAFVSLPKLHIVGCSHWITELASKSPMFKNAFFYTIYNGVDVDVFKPSVELHCDSQVFTILVMANKWFLPENTSLRRKLMTELGQEYQVRVVGCSSQQLMQVHTDDRIKYIGYLNSREELANEYRRADVFLNITYIDTLPTVNMEAMCCGTPVITYRSGGSPELIREGKTGYVVNHGDVHGIINAIERVKNGSIKRADCSQCAVKNFNKNTCYEEYVNLYNQILS